jgi:hypothetical protein
LNTNKGEEMTNSAPPPFQWLPHRAPVGINKLVIFLLQSPLHWLLSNSMLLLTFTGRVSGRQFIIPVTYFLSQGKIVIFTSNRWWKNLQAGATVTIRLKGLWITGHAEATNEHAVVMQEARAYILQKGAYNAWRIGMELPLRQEQALEELDRVTQGRAVIFITQQPF